MDASGPRVRDDMTVEVALSELVVHRGSPIYTDRIRLRDLLALAR